LSVFLVSILSHGGQCFAFSGEKVVLTTHNLPPYGSYPEQSEGKIIADDHFKGKAVDTVRCVFEKMGIALEIQVLPWKRAQLYVQQGLADGFFAASQKDSRDDYAVMSSVIADQKWNWYLLKSNPLNPEDPSFKEKATVGGFIGANMLQWMNENGYNVIATPKDTELLLKQLLASRVDAVLANNYVMGRLLKAYGVETRVKTYVNQDKPLGVYFSKKFVNSHPGFMEKFNSLIPECRQ